LMDWNGDQCEISALITDYYFYKTFICVNYFFFFFLLFVQKGQAPFVCLYLVDVPVFLLSYK
jgi:hypothetical protein